MDDINILSLKYMAWSRVKVGCVSPGHRYNFSSFAEGKSLF